MRPGPGAEYTTNRRSRRKPINVSPPSRAICTARLDGADTDARIGRPATSAFCTISNPPRPLTRRIRSDHGRPPCRSASPMALSTALCRPMSSRTSISVPSESNNPAACRPPVRPNTRCAERSTAGSRVNSSGSTLKRGFGRGISRDRNASIDVLPQMPQPDAAKKWRCSAPKSTPGSRRSVTSTSSRRLSVRSMPIRDSSDIVVSVDDAFAVEKTCRKLEVVARRAHRHRYDRGADPDSRGSSPAKSSRTRTPSPSFHSSTCVVLTR